MLTHVKVYGRLTKQLYELCEQLYELYEHRLSRPLRLLDLVFNLEESYITKIIIKLISYVCIMLLKPFLEFRLLLAQVTPYLQFFTRNCLINVYD